VEQHHGQLGKTALAINTGTIVPPQSGTGKGLILAWTVRLTCELNQTISAKNNIDSPKTVSYIRHQ
jgi:hypothetical protein